MKTAIKLSFLLLLIRGLAVHAALTVTNIARGAMAIHSLFLKSDGSLWAMGDNEYGQLGDGTTDSGNYQTNRPEQIVASGVTAVAVGTAHSLFLKSDGSLWAMGYNGDGQLGDGTYNATNRPEEIVATNVTAIAAGDQHSLFLKSDGSLWAMGANSLGELGDGTYNAVNLPEEIVASNVAAIAAGAQHSLFLKSDGSLWAMGANYHGELGDGTTDSGNFYTNRPEEIVATNVTAIAAGFGHSLFLKTDGSLWAMGNNAEGELGDGTFNATNRPEQIVDSGVTAIVAGYYHSLILKSGSLWATGANSEGELGGAHTNRFEEIVSGGVTAIAAGNAHSLFLKSDGSLWGMGWNYHGELGDSFVDNGHPGYGTGTPEQIFPPPQTLLFSALSSQTNLQIKATCGFGGNYRLLGTTNIALALSQWTPLRTNSVTARGMNTLSTITNAVNSGGRQFYILESQ